MYESLLDFLRSPLENKEMCLEVYEVGTIAQSKKQIIAGRLYTDEEEYPIINGVPRLLSTELLKSTLKYYPDFVERYKERFHIINRALAPLKSSLKQKTQESFGIQWNLFSDMYDVWRDNFLDFVSPHLKPEDFRHSLVLDCGCGFGRHLYYAAEYGARQAIGMDLSHAVDAAVKNVSRFSNAHVIQADIYNIPLVHDFDISYCIGVLQHVPDPIVAFRCISEMLKPEGKVLAWIYGKRPTIYHVAVDTLRGFTTKMRPRTLYYMTFVLSVLSFAAFVLPRRILEHFGQSDMAAKIPFSVYAKYPFRVSHADWYDRLAAPKTEYFDEKVPSQMLDATHCAFKEVSFREGGSWRIYGRMS